MYHRFQMKDDICGVCNGGSPPSKSRSKKKKAAQIKWICCDSCLMWFHAICVRITDAQMELASNFQYFCESCSIRGSLVPKSPAPAAVTCDEAVTLGNTVQELASQFSKLQADLKELVSQISKMQVELDAVKASSKKQLDRLQSKIHNAVHVSEQFDAQNRLVNNLGDKLKTIEIGAKLANNCSQAVNSCRLAINKLPFREGENVQALVEDILILLDSQNELPHVIRCFRLPVKPSKWADRSITPTVIVVFDNIESRQAILRKYFVRYKEAKLCNLKGGPCLDYRFTMNEVLSLNTFRIRNYALRLKNTKIVKSVFIKNDRVSVLLPGQKRYLPVESMDQLHELAGNVTDTCESSSLFFDALSAEISASSHC